MTVISPDLVEEYRDRKLFNLAHPVKQGKEHEHLVVTKVAKNNESKSDTSTSVSSNVTKQNGQHSTNEAADKGRPKLTVLSGDPENSHSQEPKVEKVRKVEMVKHMDNFDSAQNSLFNRIRNAASVATFIENAGVHTQLHQNLSEFETKIVNLRSIKNNKRSHISLNSRFFHLLSYAVIGKDLDLIFGFFDGTQLRLAPESWIGSATQEVKNELSKNDYKYYYSSLDLEQLEKDLHSISSYVLDNDQFIQFWIPYFPIENESNK